MKSQVLHTVWCYISGEAAGEIWNWSALGRERFKGEQKLDNKAIGMAFFSELLKLIWRSLDPPPYCNHWSYKIIPMVSGHTRHNPILRVHSAGGQLCFDVYSSHLFRGFGLALGILFVDGILNSGGFSQESSPHTTISMAAEYQCSGRLLLPFLWYWRFTKTSRLSALGWNHLFPSCGQPRLMVPNLIWIQFLLPAVFAPRLSRDSESYLDGVHVLGANGNLYTYVFKNRVDVHEMEKAALCLFPWQNSRGCMKPAHNVGPKTWTERHIL